MSDFDKKKNADKNDPVRKLLGELAQPIVMPGNYTKVPFRLEGEKPGDPPQDFALVELSGQGRNEYFKTRDTYQDEDGNTRMGWAGMYIDLIKHAVHHAVLEEKDGKLRVKEIKDLVSEEELQKWPSRIQVAAYDRIQALSNLKLTADDPDPEERAKKS